MKTYTGDTPMTSPVFNDPPTMEELGILRPKPRAIRNRMKASVKAFLLRICIISAAQAFAESQWAFKEVSPQNSRRSPKGNKSRKPLTIIKKKYEKDSKVPLRISREKGGCQVKKKGSAHAVIEHLKRGNAYSDMDTFESNRRHSQTYGRIQTPINMKKERENVIKIYKRYAAAKGSVSRNDAHTAHHSPLMNQSRPKKRRAETEVFDLQAETGLPDKVLKWEEASVNGKREGAASQRKLQRYDNKITQLTLDLLSKKMERLHLSDIPKIYQVGEQENKMTELTLDSLSKKMKRLHISHSLKTFQVGKQG